VKKMEKLLTTREIANLFRINPATVARWIRLNELPAIKIGRQYRIHQKDFAEFLNKINKSEKAKKVNKKN